MPASQVSASQSSVAVQQAPRLHESPFNNNLHASSTFSATCNPHQSPIPYSLMTSRIHKSRKWKIYPTIEKIKDKL